MQRPDIDKLEALTNAATPGEWRQNSHERLGHVVQGPKGAGRIAVAAEQFMDRRQRVANAAFIAASRQAIPDLIAYVRHLERDRDAIWRRLHGRICGQGRDGCSCGLYDHLNP